MIFPQTTGRTSTNWSHQLTIFETNDVMIIPQTTGRTSTSRSRAKSRISAPFLLSSGVARWPLLSPGACSGCKGGGAVGECAAGWVG